MYQHHRYFQCTIDVCLLVVWCPTREFFTRMEMKPLSMKSFKIWYVLGSSKSSLGCYIYCNTGHQFMMVIRSVTFVPVAGRLSLELFKLLTYRSSRPRIKPGFPACKANEPQRRLQQIIVSTCFGLTSQ